MSIQDLKRVVGSAAKALYETEKFPVGVLAVRAERAAQACPTDATLVAMSNFLNKRASAASFISRGELKDAYRRLYSQNNQFGSLFATELGLVEESHVKVAKRDPNEGITLTAEAYEKMGNPVLAQALEAELAGGKAQAPYTPKVAKAAAQTCLHELNKFALPHKIDVVAGKADLIICQATYETPKGQVAVLVPVEMAQGKALLPTVFLTQHGFADISKEALEQHILSTAGKKFNVDVNALLKAVAAVKSGAAKPLSEMDMMIAKAAAARAAEASGHGNTKLASASNADIFAANGIINQIVDSKPRNEAADRLPEADTFAAKLASTKGSAEFVLGREAVAGARSLLKQAMGNFGFGYANVALESFNDSTMNFAVAVDNRAAFNVPVKIANKVPELPKLIVVAGEMYPFTQVGISNAIKEEAMDARMLAAASPSYGLKSSELVREVHVALAEGNQARAEDALSVLQNSGDDVAFKSAFAAYMAAMSGKKVANASADGCESTSCKAVRKVAHSKHLICGHTNLPVHKVYQDQHGDCQPLYRKHIAEASTGSFMTAKILGY